MLCIKDFETAFFRALDKHAPEKKKSVRANSKPYVSKAMQVAIMKRSELSSRYRKDPSDANSLAFKKQRNFCSRLYKIERKKYYESLNLSDITDNKKFWKTMKPFLSSKTAFSQKISLKEGDKIISDDTEVANILNKNFVEAVRLLSDKGGCSNNVLNFNTIDDPLENIIHRFKNHPSIIAIKEKVVSGSFDFKPLTVEEVSTEIFKMNQKKSTTGVSIGFLKDNLDICAPTLTKILNSCIEDGIFPNELKLADITPIFKSVDSTAKKNY